MDYRRRDDRRKRPADDQDDYGRAQAHKRQRDDRRDDGRDSRHDNRRDDRRDDRRDHQRNPPPFLTHQGLNLDQLPPLPSVSKALSQAPFIHKSAPGTVTTYETLEFLGDAYLELAASHLIFHRFSHLSAGHMSQLRELLVKNETLIDFTKAYGFDRRVKADDLEGMKRDAKNKGNKGFNKILADVFEAYVAAVVLSSENRYEGQEIVDKWLAQLWEPYIAGAMQYDRYLADQKTNATSQNADPLDIYDPEAKNKLQQRIVSPQVKLSYEQWKPMIELKGDQLGQNRWYIALYLTGYGHDRKELARAEGKSKAEAGAWAAIKAMYGETKDLVERIEAEVKMERERHKQGLDAK